MYCLSNPRRTAQPQRAEMSLLAAADHAKRCLGWSVPVWCLVVIEPGLAADLSDLTLRQQTPQLQGIGLF